jgi:hypothetical protein
MNANELELGAIILGPVFPEPIQVLVITPLGAAFKIVVAGQRTGQVHQRILHPHQLQFLAVSPEREPFDGDPVRLRLILSGVSRKAKGDAVMNPTAAA